MNKHCHACGGAHLSPLLDLGPIPIAHRMSSQPPVPDDVNPRMTLHLCDDCALLQIVDPVPPDELYRDFNFCFSAWKPQPHMRDEIEMIRGLVGLDDAIVEVGSNDGTFLRELQNAGFRRRIGVEPNPAANRHARKTGSTILEEYFGAGTARRLRREIGRVALVVSRQALEHISDLRGFAEAARILLDPAGYLLLEVPDFERPMSHGDASALWEEHVNYFTEPVLSRCLGSMGFATVSCSRFPFSGGALVLVCRPDPAAQADTQAGIARSHAAALGFPKRVADFRERLTRQMEANRSAGKPNVLYGSGCRANVVVNGFCLQRLLDFVCDDQAEKQGLYLPGTGLRIEAGGSLCAHPGACFLSVNAENEPLVTKRHARYTELGGRFLSINSPSPLWIGPRP